MLTCMLTKLVKLKVIATAPSQLRVVFQDRVSLELKDSFLRLTVAFLNTDGTWWFGCRE